MAESTKLTFPEALGRTIKVLRTDQGMSRAHLARASSISYSYLSAIENGAKAPSTKIMRVIANRLSLAPHELVEAADTRMTRQAIPHATDEEDTLIEAQERRIQERQEARFGYTQSGSTSWAGAEELAELLPHLNGEDIAMLVALARHLVAAKTGAEVIDP